MAKLGPVNYLIQKTPTTKPITVHMDHLTLFHTVNLPAAWSEEWSGSQSETRRAECDSDDRAGSAEGTVLADVDDNTIGADDDETLLTALDDDDETLFTALVYHVTEDYQADSKIIIWARIDYLSAGCVSLPYMILLIGLIVLTTTVASSTPQVMRLTRRMLGWTYWLRRRWQTMAHLCWLYSKWFRWNQWWMKFLLMFQVIATLFSALPWIC